jgi:hypothetical protein
MESETNNDYGADAFADGLWFHACAAVLMKYLAAD